MVRTGGIVAFAMVVIVLALGLLVTWLAFVAVIKGGPDARDDVQSTLALIYVVSLPFGAFVLWTTRGLFRASGYPAADQTIVMLIALLAANLIHILDSGFRLTIAAMWHGSAFSVFGVFSVVAPLATVALWIWFAIKATRFGKRMDSGLWQAIGIFYLIGMALLAGGMVLHTFDDYHTPIPLIMIAAPVLLVGWACHGVGLIAGARRMTQVRSDPD